MINTLEMIPVHYKTEPHHSHKFGEKESTIVACASNDRFGHIRECKNCGGVEVWAGGPGSHYFLPDLREPCNA